MGVFPDLGDKSKLPSITNPEQLLKYQIASGKYEKVDPFPEDVILIHSNRLLGCVLENFSVRKVRGFYDNFYLLKNKGGNKTIGISKSGGAPADVMVMEELIASGVKRFVSVGEAGALQSYLNVGDFVVCERAVNGNGVSRYYSNHDFSFASGSLSSRIKDFLRKSDIDFSVGVSWSTDAFYRELVEEVKHYKDLGVLTVDMESSAIFSVAEFRGVDAAVILTVSDYLLKHEAGESWVPNFKYTSDFLAKLFVIAKDVLFSKGS